MPLVKDSETQHILLTGSGKTNMLNELLPQIRNQQDRAIIFDLTGGFVNRFFNPATDILNLPTRTFFVRLCGEYPITKLNT
ncbi:MAG: type IV secretion system DNA-binding domain-containing protein [Candidatus Rickettsia vulgarisii]